jgi:hypothetical protein
MAKPKLSNVLVISVEWGRSQGAARRSVSDGLAERMLEQLQRREFKATWALSDLRHAATRRLADAGPDHEIALEATIQTPRHSQHVPAFVTWLRDRRQRAAQAGIDIRSLVLDPLGCHPYQRFAQIGLSMLRIGGSDTRPAAGPVQPRPVRFGLYELPISVRWPTVGRHWASFWRNPMAQGVNLPALREAVAHILFDLSAMAADPDESLRQVDRFLDAAASQRDGHGLISARMSDIPRLVRQAVAARPAHSILRKAA